LASFQGRKETLRRSRLPQQRRESRHSGIAALGHKCPLIAQMSSSTMTDGRPFARSPGAPQ